MGHVRGIVLQKAQNNPAALAARGAFFEKNSSFEEHAKSQNQNPGRGISQTLSFFNQKKRHIPNWARFTWFKLGAV
ncbi:MAG: hypothetical protein H7834_01230 [Magnetococcus sp. YQC-9]